MVKWVSAKDSEDLESVMHFEEAKTGWVDATLWARKATNHSISCQKQELNTTISKKAQAYFARSERCYR